MKEYLIFRTDRVGDFLLSLSLIKIIKINHPESKITVVASERNVEYIKTFDVVNNVIILKNNFLSKLKLIFNLRKKKYESIIVHDGKNRSRFVSYFLKCKKRVVCITDLIDTQLDIIQKACIKMQLNFDLECLNFLDNRNHNLVDIPFKNYIHLHFDEKWKYNEYIKKYTDIEPDENELIYFINSLISKNKNLIITTGKISSSILNNIKDKINKENVRIYMNQNLLEIENMPILLIEIEKRHTKEPVEKSINHIKKIGYECYFVKNEELILVDKLKDKQLENNYYFLPRDFKQDL